jgi:hypothetical protein
MVLRPSVIQRIAMCEGEIRVSGCLAVSNPAFGTVRQHDWSQRRLVMLRAPPKNIALEATRPDFSIDRTRITNANPVGGRNQ